MTAPRVIQPLELGFLLGLQNERMKKGADPPAVPSDAREPVAYPAVHPHSELGESLLLLLSAPHSPRQIFQIYALLSETWQL